jgi:hypothetical protein
VRFGQRRANVHHSEAKSQANGSWLIPARKPPWALGGEVALHVAQQRTVHELRTLFKLSESKTPQTIPTRPFQTKEVSKYPAIRSSGFL